MAMSGRKIGGWLNLVISGILAFAVWGLATVLSTQPAFKVLGDFSPQARFTVEDATEEEAPPGYLLRSSGRHAHAPSHVASALTEAGFTPPKAETRDVLRREFRSPVYGRVVAAQRLALFGGR